MYPGSISLGVSYRLFLGKRPVARISAHPLIFTAELQAPMGAYPAEYGKLLNPCHFPHKFNYKGGQITYCISVIINMNVVIISTG